jgi:hypothetical protein
MNAWEKYKAKNGVTPMDLLRINSQKISAEAAEARYTICVTCPFFQKQRKQCLKCGCFMIMKTKLDLAKCPIGKWGEYVEATE